MSQGPPPDLGRKRLQFRATRRKSDAGLVGALLSRGAAGVHGSAAGHVAVTFTVGSFGQVVAADDIGGDAPVGVHACIVRGFYALSFPAPERSTAAVTYPLLLAPAD